MSASDKPIGLTLSPPEVVAPRPLRRLAIDAAKLELLAYVAGQLLRFCSSLILSRLLFPEAFGLSVTVGLVGQGLVMVSNVGASQSVVQSKRGDDPLFLNTAFTILAVRGVALWLVACVLAYPLAVFLRQPELSLLIPVGCLNVLITGLSSTSLITLRRHLRVRPLIVIEVAAQVLTLILNIALAWYFRSVWALIAAGLVGPVFSTVVSHFLKVGYRSRFQWDPTAWREIYDYGRWIQRSSALCFVCSQADRFLIAHFVSMAVLGVYNFALLLADAVSAAVVRVTHGVLFPVFSQIHREQPERLMPAYYRVRLRADVVTMLPMGILAALGQVVVNLLFDARYAEAGWMLQLLCIRAAMSCLMVPVETLLFSIGQTQYGFYRDLARSAWVLGGMPLGWHLAGMPGLVGVVALSEIPTAIVLMTALARHGRLRPMREALGPLVFGLGYGVGALLLAAATKGAS